MKSLIMVMLLSSMCSAEPLATHLLMGQKAPYEGILLNEEGSAKLNVMISEYSAVKSAVLTQNDMLINAQKKIDEYQYQVETLSSSNDRTSFWTKVLYGVGGMVVGSLVTSAGK